MFFRYQFFHPSWFETKREFSQMTTAEKNCLETQLWQFLSVGHMETAQAQIRTWMSKLNLEPSQTILEPDQIDTWPKFISTLYSIRQQI